MTAAVAVALAGASLAVPALAETGSVQPTPAATSSPASSGATAAPTASPAPGSPATASSTTTATATTAPAPGISEDGLAEATLRDLGMTLEQFNAAGELARRAADALPSLSGLPGYVGISISNGRIIVDGQGAELQARVDALNAAGLTAVFTLAAPAAPAPAPSAADLIAASTDQLFAAYVRDVGPAGLQAVAYAGGHFVIRTGGVTVTEEASATPAPATASPTATEGPGPASPGLTTAAPGKISPAAFVARYKNVQLEKSAPIATEASTDYFGGQGYVTDMNTICSSGFNAYDPTGLPVILTAGHCAEDGASKNTTVAPLASSEAAGMLVPLPSIREPLGTFGFSQFGGPGNTWVLDPTWDMGNPGTPGNVGTDIAVIQGISPTVAAQPSVSIWRGDEVMSGDPLNPGPTAVKITGITSPVSGQSVCRSGQRTGWSCGHIDEVGIYVAGGLSYRSNSNDVRAFKGFLSTSVSSAGGDSGGPWISGHLAVGTHSAGGVNGAGAPVAVATSLADALNYLPGVQLQLFLNAPQLDGTASGATLQPGTTIRGKVAAAPASAVASGSSVRLTRDGASVDLPVDKDGNWSFTLPATEGKFAYTAATVNGFSHSETTAFALTASALTAPAITTPAAVPTASAPARIEGTGTPGNTVAVTGAVTGSATVAADGRWSVPFGSGPLYGKLAVSAVQTSPGHEDGPAATAVYLVQPPVPALALSLDGSTFRQDALPKTISGTGVEGASVSVSIDGVPLDAGQGGGPGVGGKAVSGSLALAILATGGHWSVPFPTGLATGQHILTVSQSLDGIASAPLSSTFSISAPVVAAAAAVSPDRSAGTPVLASTGAGGLVPAAGAAAAAVLMGAGMLVLGRRRKPAAPESAR